MTLRITFDDAGKAGHRADHLVLHQVYNADAVILPTGVAATDTAALQAAIAAAIAATGSGSLAYGKRVTLGPGTWKINDTITIRSVEGLVLSGVGGQTLIDWQGADSAKPIFSMLHTRQCEIRDLRIVANTAADCCVYGARDNLDANPAVVPTKNVLRNLVLDCGNGNAQYGVRLGALTGWVDGNNDFWLFEHLQVSNYGWAAFGFFGAQSYMHTILNCHANGLSGTSDYGVWTGGLGGTFQWLGGSMSAHGVADFGLGRSFQPYLIQGMNSENSARLLEITSAAYVWVHMTAVRWSDLQLNADTKAINIANTVAIAWILLESCGIGEDFSDPYTDLALHVDPSNPTDSSFVLTNCRVVSTLADPYTGMAPTSTGVHHVIGT